MHLEYYEVCILASLLMVGGAMLYRSYFTTIAPVDLRKYQLQEEVLLNLTDIDLDSEYRKVIEKAYAQEGEIEAIKAYRALYGSTLREAKDFVDSTFQ